MEEDNPHEGMLHAGHEVKNLEKFEAMDSWTSRKLHSGVNLELSLWSRCSYSGQGMRVIGKGYTPRVSGTNWNGGWHFRGHMRGSLHSPGSFRTLKAPEHLCHNCLCMHCAPEVFAKQPTAAQKQDSLGKDSHEHVQVVESKYMGSN